METVITFTQDPIVIPPMKLPNREIGASVEFLGIVREMEQDSPLEGLNYEAYEPMAVRVLTHHLEELASQHPCDQVLFIHRLGWVPVGEPSLFVRVLSAHRQEALALLDELITRLKTDVPIWKSVSNKDPISCVSTFRHDAGGPVNGLARGRR